MDRKSVGTWLLVGLMAVATLGMTAGRAGAAPARDGEGTVTVSPNTVAYGTSSVSLTFVFTANIGDFGNGSQVVINFPAGWTPPSSSGPAGLVSVVGTTCTLPSSPLGIGVGAISVDIVSCTVGQTITVLYSNVTPPGPAGSPYVFASLTDIGTGGAGLVGIAAGSPSVTVTPATLTVSAAGLAPADKTYDGTTAASLTIGSPTLVGILGTDVVTLNTAGATGTFADKHVGTGKTVTISGLTLEGANAAGYVLTPPTRAASITLRPVTVAAVADSKVYDGSTVSAGVPAVSGATPLASGDAAAGLTQSYDTRHAGTGKALTPGGTISDGNGGQNYAYTFAPNTTGIITPRPITVTAVPDTKVYDGTTSSAGVPVRSLLTPLAPGDTDPVWTQSFDGIGVGTSKTLTPAGAVIDGNGGQNYACTFVPDLSGAITARPVTVEVDAKIKALGLPDPPLTYRVTSGSFVAGDEPTLTRAAGEAPGAYPISIGVFSASANYGVTFVGADLTITPSVRFISNAVQDGWVLESAHDSNLGGSANSAAGTFRLGDDALNREYRAILSFDTSLVPDAAVIQAATLRIKRSGAPVGGNPFSLFGPLLIDVRKGTFGAKALAPADYQAVPTAARVGTMGKNPVSGWHSAKIAAAGLGKINKGGITQLRLYFPSGDNGNAKAEFQNFVSGNGRAGGPELIVTYTMP